MVRVTTLSLVRHGESTWNVAALLQGHNDEARLTDLGRDQVRATATSLRDAGAVGIVSSDLARTRESAEVIAEVLGLPVSLDAGLRERNLGVFEGRPASELDPLLIGVRDGVIVDTEAATPGGETVTAFARRAQAAVERIANAYPDQHVIVVTHGGVFRVLRALESGSLLGAAWFAVANAALYELRVPAP